MEHSLCSANRNPNSVFIDNAIELHLYIFREERKRLIELSINSALVIVLVSKEPRLVWSKKKQNDNDEVRNVFWQFFGITSHILNYFVWLRITDEGLVPEMRIWSISNLIRLKMVYTS